MKYPGIVFDKDGTLLDFNRTWLPVYLYAAREFADGDDELARALLSRHGYLFEQRRFVGGSLLAAGNNRQIADEWSLQLGKPAQAEQIGARLEQIFCQQGSLQATPVAALDATLTRLKQGGHRLGVATADSYSGIINTLQAFEVLHHFDFLAGYDSGHGSKPDAGMVLAFCAQLRLAPASVLILRRTTIFRVFAFRDKRRQLNLRNCCAVIWIGLRSRRWRKPAIAAIQDPQH